MGTARAKNTKKPRLVVAVGASAGGLSALESFFSQMPADSGMAFVVIQHLSPDFKSLMDDLLARHTKMAIRRVTNGIALQPDCIYLNPPKTHVTLKKDKLHLTAREPGSQPDLPIDVFFRSLAQEVGKKAVAVILSGTGTDGSRGARDIHQAGGLVIAQSPDTAQFDGMPRSAAASGACDLVLPPEAIPAVLTKYAATTPGKREALLQSLLPEADEDGEYQKILTLLNSRYHLDFSRYKPPTVGRRIERRMEFRRLKDIDAYAALLASDQDELDQLYHDLLIGVTEFFRDTKAFSRLEELVLPELFKASEAEDGLRVWSAGCATGEEAYSLAILLAEQAQKYKYKKPITVFATDVHRTSIDFAAQGLYEEGRLKNVSTERLARFFRPEGEGSYRVVPALRKMIVFAPHNLISDPPFTRLDLVSCRNLLIYLRPDMQEKVLSLFHFALRRGGVLFLGASEGLGKIAPEFDTLDSSGKLFRKARDLKIGLDLGLDKMHGRFSAPAVMPHAAKLTVSIDRQLLQDYDHLLRQYMPAGVLINEQREVLHCFGDLTGFLNTPEGRFENDLLALAEEDLRLPLATALHRAAKTRAAVTIPHLTLNRKLEPLRCDLRIEVLSDAKTPALHYFVSILPAKRPAEEPRADALTEEILNLPPGRLPDHLQQRILDLEAELQTTRETLQTTIEELQTSNEELQATNEELLAANEELQSTNEELHSVNEELYSVNAEFEQKNEELKQVNQDHENLLTSIQIGTVYLDRNLRIRKFNPAIERFFKLLPQDIGRPLDHIAYHLADQAQMLAHVRRVLETGTVLEKEIRTQEDQWLLKRILPFITEEGTVEGVVLTFTDVTQIKRAEQALARLNQELEAKVEERTRDLLRAKEEADRANAAKSVFLANMSHEIRTPMSCIFSAIEILAPTLRDQEQKECLAALRGGAENLLAVIDDILDYSKIEAGGADLEQEPFDLHALVEEVVKIHRPRAEIKKLSLHAIVEPDLPRMLSGDAQRLRQVLSNLLSNAVKFTEQGRVEARVALEQRDAASLLVRFSVADTGIGLSSAARDTIFKPFTQADSSITRKYGGTGLGLAICQQLTQLMGGTIWYEENPGGGTLFHFTVRLTALEAQATHETVDLDDLKERVDNPGRKILVAEDDRVNRELLSRILRRAGHQVTLAADGREALEILSREPFDVVLMDVSMPELDGLSATRLLRSNTRGPNERTPVIALTAHALQEDRDRFLAGGMYAVLTKPFRVDILEQLIQQACLGPDVPPEVPTFGTSPS
ncbi:chemotaxis protein CheB [Geoalkalibacter sp.]|uniref:chemotaxis protein CheB n=1 Tax=Geoalkalibacter sp. TaxID=3041440 RepID=UPI00272DE116|nr:chemotaxis protein CheB [Geoalkalibacter sp.]